MVDVAEISPGGEDDGGDVMDDVTLVTAAPCAVKHYELELVDGVHDAGFPFSGVGSDFLHSRRR